MAGAIDVDGTGTRSLVSDRFNLSAGYADSAFATANGYLTGEGIGVSFTWTPPDGLAADFPPGLTGLNPIAPDSPDINQISVGVTEFTHPIPTLEDHVLTPLNVPEFNVTMPDFYIPAAPTTQVPVFTREAPEAGEINLPTADEIPDLPALPTLTEILPPEEPDFQLPDFAATMPVMDLTPPDNLFSWNEAAYDSELSRTLKNKIIDGILNGGQGMLEEVEQAIYDRAASRLNIEEQKNEQLALNDFASRGARIPQGALIARLNEIRQQNLLAREDLARDVMIKSADMAYQYSTFIINKGIELERDFMNLFNNIQNRAFEAAKMVVEFAFAEYETRVKAYSAQLEGYRTEAEIFKARISAEIARAELYKTTIEGRKLSMEMQGLMVDLYGKQLAAIDTMAKIYATKMDAAKVQAEIGAVQIERFKAQVEAYKAQVDGVTAEYNLYQAQIAGESEKAKMYAYQVDGYKSVVEAYKTRSDVDISTMRAKVEKSQGEINIFTAMIDKYRADIQANVSEAEIQARAEGLKIQAFEGEITKFTSTVAALTESYKAATSTEVANAEIQLRYGDMLARIETAQAEINAELIKAKAQVSSQLAASALSSVSAGASVGYSASEQESSTYSNRVSTSTSTSTDTNHNYNYQG